MNSEIFGKLDFLDNIKNNNVSNKSIIRFLISIIFCCILLMYFIINHYEKKNNMLMKIILNLKNNKSEHFENTEKPKKVIYTCPEKKISYCKPKHVSYHKPKQIAYYKKPQKQIRYVKQVRYV